MINSALTIGYWAEEWKDKLTGSRLVSCFTIGKTQFFFVFENEVYGKLELQHGRFFYQNLKATEVPEGSRFYIFESLFNRSIAAVVPHWGERSFHMQFDNGETLVFKLHGPHTNLIHFNTSEPLGWWRFGMLRDRENNLDYYTQNIKDKTTFIQNLKPTETPPNFLKKEEKEAWLTSTQNQRVFWIDQMLNGVFFVGKIGRKPYFSFWPVGESDWETTFTSITEALAAFSGRYLGYKKWKDTRQVLVSELDKRIMKKGNLILKYQEQAQKLAHNDFQEKGDLLMAYAFQVPLESEEVKLISFHTGKEVVIKLKSGQRPQKNAERYYKKAKNARQRLEELEREVIVAQSELASLQERRAFADQAESYKELVKLRKAIPAEKTIEAFYKVEELGYQFWIGKHAQSNDVILQKAHKDDWWFHARDVRGSHVLVKSRGEDKLPEKVLELAAGFAAYYSKAKTEQLAPVQYTRRKFVRKKKGLHAGQVILEREEVILAEPVEMG